MSDWIPPTGDNKPPQAGEPSAPAAGQPVQWPVAPPNYSQPSAKRRGIPVWVFVLSLISAFVVGLLIAIIFNIASGVADDYAYEDLESGDTYSSNSTTFGTNGDLESVDAAIGGCFKGSISEDGVQVESIEDSVACSRPHQLEVFASTDAPVSADAQYDAETLSYYANGYCELSFEPYIGTNYYDSEYTYASVIPSRDAWGEGSRQVVCFVSPYAGETVDQSLQNIQR